MAITIPYESRQGIAAANAGGVAQYRNASAFMTPGQENLGRGMQRLAAGVDRLNTAWYAEEVRKNNERIELEAIEDMQGFQANAQAWDDDFRKNNTLHAGANAENAAREYYKNETDRLVNKWSGNTQVQAYIKKNAGSMAVSGINAMRDYANKQQEAWKDSVFAGEKATYENFLADPARTPDEIGEATREFTSKYTKYSLSKGLDPTAAREEVWKISNTAMTARSVNTINAMIEGGNLAEAGRMLEGRPRHANLPPEIIALADEQAARQGVDPDFVKAVIMAESAGKTDAVSKAGALGTMQLMPGTAKEMGVADPFDAAQNITGGVGYLKKMLGMFGGDKRAAAIAYNAGPGNAKKILAGTMPMPAETKDYLNKVLQLDDKAVSAFLPTEKKMALERKLAVAQERQRKIAEEQAVTAAYTALSGVVKDAPTLADQNALFRKEAEKIEDRDIRGKVLKAWEEDYKEKEALRDATDMALVLELLPQVKGMTTPEKIEWIRGVWRGSEEGFDKAAGMLMKPPAYDTKEAVADYDKLLVEIDERNRGDAPMSKEEVEARAWKNGYSASRVTMAQAYLKAQGQAGIVKAKTVQDIWLRLNPGMNVKAMPPDLRELVLQRIEPGKPVNNTIIQNAIAALAVSGETRMGGMVAGFGRDETLADAMREGRGEKWVSDENIRNISAYLAKTYKNFTYKDVLEFSRDPELMKLLSGDKAR